MSGEFEEAVNMLAESSNLTTTQSAGALGLVGGFIAGMGAMLFVGLIIFYILYVIANWRIFTKAGEAGWKSIIPIYNVYVLCKIIGVSFWKWVGIFFAIGVVAAIFKNVAIVSTILSIVQCVLTIVYGVIIARNTGDAFGKGTGFKVGLFFLPSIFQLILGFGSAQYQGVPQKQ